jgi:hypothetical protein
MHDMALAGALRRSVLLCVLVSTVGDGQGVAEALPRTIVRDATHAADRGSISTIAEHWRQVLVQRPHDRAATLGLATVARLEYRYDDAERLYATLITPGDSASAAFATYAWLGLGWGFDARRFVPRAESAFSTAWRNAHTGNDSAAESEALIGLSIRATHAGIPVGLALLDSAARLTPAGRLDLEAEIAIRRAVFAVVQMEPSAEADALAAAALARRANTPRLEAKALRALALSLKLRTQNDSSLAVLTRVEQIERSAGDRSALSETLARHADVYHATSDIGPFKAYSLAARAEAVASRNTWILAVASTGLGSISLLLHDFVAAREYLDEAAAQYDSMQDSSGIMLVRAYQADLAVEVGDLTRARAMEEEALAFRHRIGDVPEEFEYLRNLVVIDIQRGDLARAAADLGAARTIAATRHMTAWQVILNLDQGRLALASGHAHRAAAILAPYVRSLDTASHLDRYTGRVLLAEALAQRGKLRAAESELTAAADELDTWRATLTDRSLRPYVFQVSTREFNERDAGSAAVLAAMVRGGRPGPAFALAERRRARDLADRMLRLAALRDSGGVPTPESGTPGAGPSSQAQLNHPTARGRPDTAGGALPDAATAILEYATGAFGAPTLLFVLSPAVRAGPRDQPAAALHAFVLPAADSLAPLIARFVALLEDGDEAGELARALGSSLLDSALGVLDPGVRRLVIVPDGPIHRVPFDALRSANSMPVVARYAVSIAPSAAVVRGLWQRFPVPASGALRMLAMADPAFATRPISGRAVQPASRGRSGGTDTYRDVFDSAGGLPRLSESRHEALMVAKYAPDAEVRLGEAASAAYLLHAPLMGFRVIHIATHALVDERTIARTALALAPSRGDNGFVTPSELAGLQLAADLVVLSACRTAGGVVIDGEGVQGLTGPLLAAGARSVVATQWQVRDRETVPFIRAFYDALARGLPVTDALAAAKRDAIARHARTGDWAAFTVVGDPLVVIPLSAPRRHTVYWFAFALAALAALVLSVLLLSIAAKPQVGATGFEPVTRA